MSIPRTPLRVVRTRNGNDERIVLTAPCALDTLPPMDIPQPTEPAHFGASAKSPPPVRTSRELSKRTHAIYNAILYVLCTGTLLWITWQAVTTQ